MCLVCLATSLSTILNHCCWVSYRNCFHFLCGPTYCEVKVYRFPLVTSARRLAHSSPYQRESRFVTFALNSTPTRPVYIKCGFSRFDLIHRNQNSNNYRPATGVTLPTGPSLRFKLTTVPIGSHLSLRSRSSKFPPHK